MFLKILFFGILILGCGAYILAAYSDFFIVTIFGNEYSDSSRILKIMMCTLLVNFFAVCLGYPALSISGNLKWANKSVIVASTLFLICIAILFYKDYITPTSMAITVFFTELLVAGIRLFFVAKYQLRKNILIN